MRHPPGLRPALDEAPNDIVVRLSPAERDSRLVKCWMSHDARWPMAVVVERGLEVIRRRNLIAAGEVGRVEARRILRALQLSPVTDVDERLLTRETFVGLLAPGLLEYDLNKVGDDAYELCVGRCFADDDASRAGVTDGFGCGIFARMTGRLDALDLTYELTPATDECLEVRGADRTHPITIQPAAPGVEQLVQVGVPGCRRICRSEMATELPDRADSPVSRRRDKIDAGRNLPAHRWRHHGPRVRPLGATARV